MYEEKRKKHFDPFGAKLDFMLAAHRSFRVSHQKLS